jgi:hypothetical protein
MLGNLGDFRPDRLAAPAGRLAVGALTCRPF